MYEVLATMSLMVSMYGLTRMVEVLTKTKNILLTILAIATVLVSIYSGIIAFAHLEMMHLENTQQSEVE